MKKLKMRAESSCTNSLRRVAMRQRWIRTESPCYSWGIICYRNVTDPFGHCHKFQSFYCSIDENSQLECCDETQRQLPAK